jgi:dihydroxyacetone kinase-like protein
MASQLDAATLRLGWARIADHLAGCAQELNAADAALGDGDIGRAVSEGFAEVKADLETLPEDLGMALMKSAQAVTRRGGSSYATILATAMMGAASVLKGKTAADWSLLSPAMAAAVEKAGSRARSAPGDKTVLDSMEAVRRAVEGLEDPEEMKVKALEAARKALEEFRDRPCKQGRARIFAEKSRGLDDPGMLAFTRIVEALQ